MIDKNLIYDVVIIGAGPAGLFAAMQLSDQGKKVLLIDQGPDLDERVIQSQKNEVTPFGFGGSGGFSDGKVIFSTETGGRLSDLMEIVKLNNYIQTTQQIWRKFSSGLSVDDFTELSNQGLKDKAASYNLHLIVSDTLHIGTDILPSVLQRMRNYLIENNVDMVMDTTVDMIINRNFTAPGYILGEMSKFRTVAHSPDDEYFFDSNNIIIAPGRGGSKWLSEQIESLGLDRIPTPVDIGVRVEVPAKVTEHLTNELYEFKLKYQTPSYNDWVRTFCVCPYGQVSLEKYESTTLVNGYSNKNKNSQNTNFAFLSSIQLGPPLSKPLEFSENIIRTTNSIANGALVQRLGDLMRHKRTKSLDGNNVEPTLLDASPGDLGLAYPYRFVTNILEGLKAIDKMAPGIFSDDTLLYAPEIKLYSSMADVDENMMSKIDGLYFIGDGSGVTRGIAQACVTGLISADHILNKK